MPHHFGQKFGELVRRRREAMGLSSGQLAELAFGDEARRSRVSELENGKVARPQARTIQALAEVLSLSSSDIDECKVELHEEQLLAASNFDQALSILHQMEASGVSADAVTFNALITKAESFDQALSTLHQMEASGISADAVTFNALIAKTGSFDQALSILHQMEASGLSPGAVTFSALIAKAESFDQAISILHQMEASGLDNPFHVAQTLHSFATALCQQNDRLDEAEDAFRRSIEISQKAGNELGVAQALHSLANLLRTRARFREAEDAYRQSADIFQRHNKQLGVAQCLHSLGILLSQTTDRLAEAQSILRESIAIGEQLQDNRHLAAVLRSFASTIGSSSTEEAIQLMQASLGLNRRLGNHELAHQIQAEIADLRERSLVSHTRDG